MSTVHGISTYIAGGSDPARSKSTIIYLPDAFGLKLVNNKLLADKYASVTGCRVLIPDVLLNGGMPAWVLEKFEYVASSSLSVTNFLPKVWTIMTILPKGLPFMIWGHPSNSYDKILKFARAEHAALPSGGKLGVCGFCWGAWPSTKLCSEPSVPGGNTPLISAQFNGHPSYIIKEPEMVPTCIKAFKTPYSAAIAEKDMQFNSEESHKVEAKLREVTKSEGKGEGGYEWEFRHYPGATHGFCVKAREADMGHYHGAVKQATEWFGKYLN
jgi:dienelactone hydrolase